MTFKNDRAPSRQGADLSASIPEHLEKSDVSDATSIPPRPSALRLIHVNLEIANRPATTQLAETSRTDTQDPEMTPERHAVMLDRALQARIGAMLREVFCDMANAPVPDRFVGLLEALAAKDKSRA